MALEIDWQAKIVKRLKMEGCYARKASSSYAVGVLDLDVIIPAFGGMKIEVKLETGLQMGKPWKRTIEYTEKQKEESTNIIKAKGAALGLVVCHFSPANVSLHAHFMPAPRVSYTLTAAEHNLNRVQWSPSAPGTYLSNYLIEQWGE